MARPRKLDRNEAVMRAVAAFWRHGYGVLGVRQLEKETGINRFMLQTEFGGKEQLFVEALSTYTLIASSQIFCHIHDGGIDEICEFFMRRVDDKQSKESSFGCLVMNSIVDGMSSTVIKQAIDRHLKMVEMAFKNALSNEQNLRGLKDGIVIDESAEFLLSHAIGLNLLIKNHTKNSAGLASAKGICQTLRGWQYK